MLKNQSNQGETTHSLDSIPCSSKQRITWDGKALRGMTVSTSHIKHSVSLGLDSPLEGSICRLKFSQILKKLSLVEESKSINY